MSPRRLTLPVLATIVALIVLPSPALGQGDQLTWGVHISLAPTWFDPAEAPGIITPFMIYDALHDALAKPMPGQPLAPSLAESWTVSKDHLTHEFVLRKGVQGASGAFGNAATRLEAFVAAGGAYVYGSYPDIDGLFQEQAAELDLKRREATLHRIQQLVHDRGMYAPIWQLAFLNGVGPRVEHSGLGMIPGFAYSGPYEDVKLRK